MYEILGKENCPYCDMAKGLLQAKGKEFYYIDISDNEEQKQRLTELGLNTVPQIWLGDKHIGGFDELTLEV